MMQATWNGQVIAESDQTVVVEGNHYFPAESIKREYFTDSTTTSYCGWKGDCSYYNLEVGGDQNSDAAWYYPKPLQQAEHIRGYVAFWKGVEVSEK